MPGKLHYGPLSSWVHSQRFAYGWAVTHTTPDGTPVSIIWTDDTSPEMSPGTQRFSALHHAVTLLVDGSVYPDQVTVTAWYGGLGAFTMTGDEAAELFQTEYDEEHQDPAYWAELDTALAD